MILNACDGLKLNWHLWDPVAFANEKPTMTTMIITQDADDDDTVVDDESFADSELQMT